MKVKIGMKGEKRVNRLIKNIAKSAQIVIAIFVVYYDVSIKETLHLLIFILMINTGCFFHWYPPKMLKYGKPRLGESTLT